MSKTLPKGHASCLAPGFKYTPSAHTDLAKTFARIRRRLKPKPDPNKATFAHCTRRNPRSRGVSRNAPRLGGNQQRVAKALTQEGRLTA